MKISYTDQFLERLVRAFNARDWDAYGRAFAEALVTSAPGLNMPAIGRDARVRSMQAMVNAFPDARIERIRSFAQGDWVCAELLFTGTHTRALSGADGASIPPSHQPVQLPYCLVFELERGEIAELHEYFDQLALLPHMAVA